MSLMVHWFRTCWLVSILYIVVAPDLNNIFLFLFRPVFHVVGRRGVSSRMFIFFGSFSIYVAPLIDMVSYVRCRLWLCYC